MLQLISVCCVPVTHLQVPSFTPPVGPLVVTGVKTRDPLSMVGIVFCTVSSTATSLAASATAAVAAVDEKQRGHGCLLLHVSATTMLPIQFQTLSPKP